MGRSFATEMAYPCRVRFWPDSGMTDETQTRPVEALFGSLRRSSMPPVIRQKPREQTRTNVHDLDRETLILLECPGRELRS
ncbi:MAG: hypothetical protein NVS2B7_34250 [Herpetosiphon sp.]